MKKILLVCAAGMSTSMLVNKMRESAEEKNIDVSIAALSVSEASTSVDTVDVVLLGPQVRYQLKSIEEIVKGRIPVKVIDIVLYGRMDGKAVLEYALELIK
ncbi:PTS sugar transporter subunit IIB [Clostridium intestinale]|uniref:PTS system lactose/cellobiose-specific transporter subunit IIB n=1 Tax=Clostridium intestinale URNW TaxID=1294142 RepID=U2NKQ2_9CLOT|nr:PTS sugar transporter subunit IIB [Clostridium intestinale]ERK29718.1 PTS system lactose/cellobiose-specific transporter subunit IIB [Clostridium intestinale URNW]